MSSFHSVYVLPTTSVSFQDLSGSPFVLATAFPFFQVPGRGAALTMGLWTVTVGSGCADAAELFLLGQGWEQ